MVEMDHNHWISSISLAHDIFVLLYYCIVCYIKPIIDDVLLIRCLMKAYKMTLNSFSEMMLYCAADILGDC